MNMENNSLMGVMKASILHAFVFLCMVVGFVTIWQIITNSDRRRIVNPTEELTSSCEETGGVMIAGINQHGDTYNRFAVCVPYEALTCIDVE